MENELNGKIIDMSPNTKYGAINYLSQGMVTIGISSIKINVRKNKQQNSEEEMNVAISWPMKLVKEKFCFFVGDNAMDIFLTIYFLNYSKWDTMTTELGK